MRRCETVTTLKRRLEKLEAVELGRKSEVYDRIIPLLTDAELEALADMPEDGPISPEAQAAMLRMWELAEPAERRLMRAEGEAAGVLGAENGV